MCHNEFHLQGAGGRRAGLGVKHITLSSSLSGLLTAGPLLRGGMAANPQQPQNAG